MNTGYPALDPTANKNISGSGWEIMIFCVFVYACYVFFLCLFLFFLSKFVLCIILCAYICFFDCKCNISKILGENIKINIL